MSNSEVTKALRHLKKDSKLKKVIEKYSDHPFDRGQRKLNPHAALTRAIIFQQLSGKAARSILEKFLIIYDKKFPTPQKLRKTSVKKLRSAGISERKARYLHDLSDKFLDGTLNPRKFAKMSDEEIHEHVVAVKGVGPWTADMFLIFTLNRMDVLPTGDLGIRRGFKKLFNLRSLPTPEKMEKIAAPWRPYRTVACWYLWRLSDEGNKNR